jgi:hypothetical protein
VIPIVPLATDRAVDFVGLNTKYVTKVLNQNALSDDFRNRDA